MHIDRRLLGWGLFLIIVGAIPLLVRGGYLDEGLVRGWPSLWPLLLIGWGIGLVLRKTPGELIGSAISVAVLGAMVGGLIATGFGGFPAFGACGDGEGGTAFSDRTGTLGERGRVGIEFNCGTLNVGAADGSDWSISGTSRDGRAPRIDADGDSVEIAPPDDDDWFGFGEAGSNWDITLPRSPELSLGVTLNAGDGTFDLDGVAIDGISLTLNAGAIDFNLGDATAVGSVSATVNAGSASFDLPAGVESLSMTLNAGSIEVCVPSDTLVRVSWSGALGSNNFDGAGLDKLDDQHWESSGLNPASDTFLDMSISANAGSFDLDLGGACNA
ncbi:MAG TPA: hypothetical protein VFX65_10800 [Candidatus Limnocylindrales bacterium]|nr:hypothetical protein [Candidatus Limnocylindrales bacterium]